MNIHLGYEVGTGDAVAVPAAHLAVAGQTQQSGKTTTLEALVARSGLRALAFVTKRGEGAFRDGRGVRPYFRERADWQYVASLIDATLGEKNKLLRAWLMKVCRGTRTLADVLANVRAAKDKARGFAESIYTEIEGYLELVVPQLAQLPPAAALTLGPGLNVMDLSGYRSELQALCIRSALEHVYEHERGVVTVIPEAWEFLPEGRGSPVRLAAETLIRKGATLGNFVWLDSQDLAGVWKLALRAASVWLLGVQREANEVKRTLANIPAGIAKPSAAAIAGLGLGQFFACWKGTVKKVYVQPAWMSEDTAIDVARGIIATPATLPRPHPEPTTTESPMSQALEHKLDQLTDLVRELAGGRQPPSATATAAGTPAVSPFDEEALYQRFRARLVREAPALLRVLTHEPEIRVAVEQQQIDVDGTTLKGRLALLLLEGFFDDTATGQAAYNELKRRGVTLSKPNVYREMNKFAEMGFVTVESGGFRAVPAMKKNVEKRGN